MVQKLSPAEKFQIVCELLEFSEHAFIMRTRAKNPNICEPELNQKVLDWYKDRPGAHLGDCDGEPVDLSRFGINAKT